MKGTCEFLDLAGPGLLVESLGIALLALGERGVDVNFNERELGCLMPTK